MLLYDPLARSYQNVANSLPRRNVTVGDGLIWLFDKPRTGAGATAPATGRRANPVDSEAFPCS